MVFGIGNVQESDLKQHLFHIGLKGPRGRVVQLDTSDIAWVLLLLRYGYVGTAVYIFCVYFMMTRVYYRNKSYPIGYAVLVFILYLLLYCLFFLLAYAHNINETTTFFQQHHPQSKEDKKTSSTRDL